MVSRPAERADELCFFHVKEQHSMAKPQPASPTTAQSLGALLKSARDIMRKDKGLNGDLDRLPMLTWIMFLKFLDDLELQREGRPSSPPKSSSPPSNRLIAGAIGLPSRTALPATNSSPSSTTRRRRARTANAAGVCSVTCARSPVPTATIAGMLSPPCSRAWITA